ncbi:hypothetical protein SAMN04487998_3409 [Hymenobacter actinosclerus]|uniref:Uncharacterized protein n=1 Tax=Hymenobacter actinosclerus TaxID=82805 RepID=A0A1I0INI0_9BACT|nr:hypothetical protein SAMN04487998_3409 [Hymenobacter actinosclerus]
MVRLTNNYSDTKTNYQLVDFLPRLVNIEREHLLQVMGLKNNVNR